MLPFYIVFAVSQLSHHLLEHLSWRSRDVGAAACLVIHNEITGFLIDTRAKPL
jgi:hypothetical protein